MAVEEGTHVSVGTQRHNVLASAVRAAALRDASTLRDFRSPFRMFIYFFLELFDVVGTH